MIKKIHNFLLHTSRVKFVSVAILLAFGVKFLMTIFTYLLAADDSVLENSPYMSFSKMILVGVLFAPFIETLIFQVLFLIVPLGHLVKRTKMNYIVFGLLSAILFGLGHTYSIYYIFYAFGIGLYLSYITIVTAFLREEKVSVWVTVFGAHMLINLLALSAERIFLALES